MRNLCIKMENCALFFIEMCKLRIHNCDRMHMKIVEASAISRILNNSSTITVDLAISFGRTHLCLAIQKYSLRISQFGEEK